MTKFGTKSALFAYFWARILRNYCHNWNQHLQISVIAKFCKQTKMPKFGTKMPYLGIFWEELKKNYRQIWNQPPQICLFAKISRKNKNA